MPVQAQRGGGFIAPTHLQPGSRARWVVSTTLWPPYPLERPGIYCTGQHETYHAPLGFDPSTVQPIASHYTNYDILAAHCIRTCRKFLCPASSATHCVFVNNVNVKQQNFSVSAGITDVE